jgi:hypothetical protein
MTGYPGVFVPGAPEGNQVLVRDLDADTTIVASRAASYANGNVQGPALSRDGSTVAFISSASNLVGPDGDACLREEEEGVFVPTNCLDVFVRDLASNALEKASVPESSTGASEANGHSWNPQLSGSGRFVTFYSYASNLVPGDTNGEPDAFVRDRLSGTTERISLTSAEGQLTAGVFISSAEGPAISADGRFVVFGSQSTQLAPDANGSTVNLFLRDRQFGETIQISPSAFGGVHQVISADGNFVLFQGYPGGPAQQVFVWSRGSGETTLASVTADGSPADADATSRGISGDGSVILFQSSAANLGAPAGPPGYGQTTQLFLRGPAPAFVDADGDGVDDSIDSGNGAFTDSSISPPTTGQIVATNGLVVRIEDASAAGVGVKITVGAGSGQVVLSVCGGITIRIAGGSEVTVTCGSVTLEVVSGGPAEIVLGGGITVVSVPQGAKVKVAENPGGSFGVENLGGVPVTITIDGVTTVLNAGSSRAVRAWHFDGFFQPVDAAPVLNSVKAGAAVPLKWRLMDGQGNPVTTLALPADAISVENYSCGLATTTDAIEELAAGASGLQNLGNGYYQLNWKTSKVWTGSCKTMHLDLGEGISRDALFKFTR